MQQLEFRKEDVIEIIRKNKQIYADEYGKAVSAYFEHCEIELNKAKDLLSQSDTPVRLLVNVQPPTNNLPEYDRALRMLEMTTQEVITLTQQEFDQYINNNWQFRHMLRATGASYTNSVAHLDFLENP